jgi:Tfp pilus assembly protein PilN
VKGTRRRVNILSNGLRAKLELPHEALPVAVGAIGLAVVLVTAVQQGVSERRKHALLQELGERNLRLTAEAQAFADRSRALTAQSEQSDTLQKLVARKNYWSDAFKELSSIVPDGVWLTNFSHHPETPSRRLELSGQATDQARVAEFFGRLERSRNFAGAVMLSSVRDESVAPAKFVFKFAVPAAGVPVTPDAKWAGTPPASTTTTTTSTLDSAVNASASAGARAALGSAAANAAPAAPTQLPPTVSAQAPSAPGTEGKVR